MLPGNNLRDNEFMRPLEPYQQRVIVEKKELDTKLDALTAFLSSGVIPITENEKNLLIFQHAAMSSYSKILGLRIDAFKPS